MDTEQEKKGGPDRPRRRAAERNAKTEAVKLERRLHSLEDEDLHAIVADGALPAELRDKATDLLEERRDLADHARLCDLATLFADEMDRANLDSLELGEGLNRVTITRDDFERIADLLELND